MAVAPKKRNIYRLADCLRKYPNRFPYLMGGDCRRPIAAQYCCDLFGLKNCQRTWEKYRLVLYFGQKRAFSDLEFAQNQPTKKQKAS